MKAILLGSLGVLADTSALRRSAFEHAFREYGLDFKTGAVGALDKLYNASAQEVAPRTVAVGNILQARNRYFAEGLAAGPLSYRAGIAELLDTCEQEGMPLGLVLSTPPDWSRSAFKALNLAPEVFDTIITLNDVTASKPEPDCYHLAAAMLATAPEDCLALEDTPSGLAAARATGMQVLDLSGPQGAAPTQIEALTGQLRAQRVG